MPRKVRFRNVGAGKGVKERLAPALLHSLYVDQHMTQADIARRYDCSPQFVSQLLREYGIRR